MKKYNHNSFPIQMSNADRDRFPWPSYMWLAVDLMRGIIWLCKKAISSIKKVFT